MREHLIAQLQKANNSSNFAENHQIYSMLLQSSELYEFLSQKEIADIYYNRALNGYDLAQLAERDQDYRGALLYMRYALSDLRTAQVKYSLMSHRLMCQKKMTEYNEYREKIRAADPDFDRREALLLKEYQRIHGIDIQGDEVLQMDEPITNKAI